MERTIGDTRVTALTGDLTEQEVDAIVNAANTRLQHGGGVAAAIVRAGGQVIQDESDRFVAEHGELGVGDAATTSAGSLPARWVIHVAGPVYDEGADTNERDLRAAVRAALDAAARSGARTVALPAISAGIYGYPRDRATAVIADEVVRWSGDHAGTLDEVRLVALDEDTRADFAAGIEKAGH